MYKFLPALFVCLTNICVAQVESFPFGRVGRDEIVMKIYEKDTSASALVLKELGQASIFSGDEINLVYHYHVKIKILKKNGLSLADIAIPIYKDGGKYERLSFVKASSFNLENGLMKESKLNPKQVFTETIDKNWELKKLAIPNVIVGTVIEYEYEVVTPTPFFYTNFKSWSFQNENPKVSSEYWATIPANWRYNIALRGLHPLAKNESEVLDDYFNVAGRKADCVRYKWAMENIPAFYEEEYMTSKKNFLSAIHFELLQIEYFDGRKDKITKEWKDVEQELRTWDKFGAQLRKGKEVVDDKIEALMANESDSLEKAKKIYDFIGHWYQWNEKTGYYSETGIKKAFDARQGNVGDINLSLIAALRFAGLDTEPLILSTRDNGLPTDLFPVLSEFNYVVAKLNLAGKVYLLDATDPFMPFGLLPQRCLNGRGRVLGEKESYWHELAPSDRSKYFSSIVLNLDSHGIITGSVKTTYLGYKAVQKRKAIYSFPSVEGYIKETQSHLNGLEIKEYSFTNLEDLDKPLVETLTIKIENAELSSGSLLYFNPFFLAKWHQNPFRSAERLYPVDFGVPLEEIISLSLELPPNFQPSDLPENIAIALPNNGGRLLFQAQSNGQKLNLNSALLIAKPIFLAQEYPYLKEYFNLVVRNQSTDLVFRKIGK
jgi:hypothetical protein